MDSRAWTHLWPWALAAALLVSATGCDRAKASKQAAPAPPPPPPVVVAQIEQRMVPIVRDFTARIEAVQTVDVRARVAGVLEKVHFQEGAEVKTGQTLYTIQKEEYTAQLASTRAQLAKATADLTRAKDTSIEDRARAVLDQRLADLEKARADVARYRPLAAVKAIPRQDLDTAEAAEKVAVAAVQAAEAALKDTQLSQRTQIELAEAAIQSARASVTQSQLNLSYTTITSPVNGIIGKTQVNPGNLVGKSEPTLLVTVSTIHPIYVDFAVPEVDYLRLANRVRLDPQGRATYTQLQLELYLADNALFRHKGRVAFVDRAVDLKTGTIAVRAEFPNPEKLLRPGQFARVRGVIEERQNAVLVPQRAIQEQQGAKTVLVVDVSDNAALRPITVDERVGDSYIVHGGLKAGERVVIEGAQRVRPGMQVKPEAKAATTSPPGGPAPAAAPAEPAKAAKPAQPSPAATPPARPAKSGG